jgi:cytochrome c-type biogenesis protein
VEGLAETVGRLIFDANVLVAGVVAFAAGIVSFASPCVVPLVPGYLSYVTGLSGEDLVAGEPAAKGRVALGTSLFVLGFAIPFTMLGVAVGALHFLAQSAAARIIMGGLVVTFGLLMATGRLVREFRVAGTAPSTGLAAAPVLGFVFGVGWTPCIGPALAAILTLSATTGGSLRGGILGFVFALGIGLPFLVFGLAFRRMTGALAFLRRNARRLQIVGGGLLIAVGIAIATGLWDQLIIWMRPWITGFEPPI